MAAPSSFPSVTQPQNPILLPNGSAMSNSSYVIASSAPLGSNAALQPQTQPIVCAPTTSVGGLAVHPGAATIPQHFTGAPGVTYVFQPGAAQAVPTTQPQFFRLADGRIAMAAPAAQQVTPTSNVRPLFSQLPIAPQQRTQIQPQPISSNPIQSIQPATSGNALIVQPQLTTSTSQNPQLIPPIPPAPLPGSSIALPQGPVTAQPTHFIPPQPGIAFTRLPNGTLAAVSPAPAVTAPLLTGSFPQSAPLLTTSTSSATTVTSAPQVIPVVTTNSARPVLARKNPAIAAKKDPKPAEVLKRLEVQINNLNKSPKLSDYQKERLKQLTSARDQLLKVSLNVSGVSSMSLASISPLNANASTTVTSVTSSSSKPSIPSAPTLSNGLPQQSTDSSVESIPINVHLPMTNGVRQEVLSTLKAYNLFPKCALNTTMDDTFVVEFRMTNQRYQLRMTRQQKLIMERLLSSLKPQRQAEILSFFHQEQIKIPITTTSVSHVLPPSSGALSQPGAQPRPQQFFIGQAPNRAPQMAFATSPVPGSQLRFLAAQPTTQTLGSSRPATATAHTASVRSNSPQLIRMPIQQALPIFSGTATGGVAIQPLQTGANSMGNLHKNQNGMLMQMSNGSFTTAPRPGFMSVSTPAVIGSSASTPIPVSTPLGCCVVTPSSNAAASLLCGPTLTCGTSVTAGLPLAAVVSNKNLSTSTSATAPPGSIAVMGHATAVSMCPKTIALNQRQSKTTLEFRRMLSDDIGLLASSKSLSAQELDKDIDKEELLSSLAYHHIIQDTDDTPSAVNKVNKILGDAMNYLDVRKEQTLNAIEAVIFRESLHQLANPHADKILITKMALDLDKTILENERREFERAIKSLDTGQDACIESDYEPDMSSIPLPRAGKKRRFRNPSSSRDYCLPREYRLHLGKLGEFRALRFDEQGSGRIAKLDTLPSLEPISLPIVNTSSKAFKSSSGSSRNLDYDEEVLRLNGDNFDEAYILWEELMREQQQSVDSTGVGVCPSVDGGVTGEAFGLRTSDSDVLLQATSSASVSGEVEFGQDEGNSCDQEELMLRTLEEAAQDSETVDQAAYASSQLANSSGTSTNSKSYRISESSLLLAANDSQDFRDSSGVPSNSACCLDDVGAPGVHSEDPDIDAAIRSILSPAD